MSFTEDTGDRKNKKKKDKKDKADLMDFGIPSDGEPMPTFGDGLPPDDPFVAMGGDPAPDGFGDFGGGLDDGGDAPPPVADLGPDFGSPMDGAGHLDAIGSKDAHLDAFEAVLAADREVVHELKHEVDRFGDEVRREQEEGRVLQSEVQERQNEREDLIRQERELAERLMSAKARLSSARHEHRGMSVEHVSLNTDRARAAEELGFLSAKTDDDQRTIAFFAKANERLEKLNMDLGAQLATLEQERKNLTAQSQQEKEAAKREERQLAELRNRVDQLRRGKLAMHFQQQEAQTRDEFLRDVKRGTAMPPPTSASPTLPTRPQARPIGSHSWASHVSTAQGPRVPGSATRAPNMLAPGVGVHF